MGSETRLISDKELYDLIVKLIKEARRDLKISSPWIYNCDHLLDEIDFASKRGVKVTVVMRPIENDINEINYKHKTIALEKLKAAKVNMVFDPYVHEKIVIADGKKMIVSSANLIGTSLTRNGESGTYSSDEREIKKYEARLESKYRKTTVVKTPTMLLAEPKVFAGVLLVVLLVVALLVLTRPGASSPTNLGGSRTPSEVIASGQFGVIVSVHGTVERVLPDYVSKKGNVFQQFYLTDGKTSLKVFCSKSPNLEVHQGDLVKMTAKFQVFSGEYELADPCSKIEKQA